MNQEVQTDSSSRRLRVAVVGAGPAGFYAADALLKQGENVSIDIFDRLPTPYGLVRFGVAPDHQKIKSVTRLYEKTGTDPRVRFFGNVALGRDLDAEDLHRHYDAVVYAVGAPADRGLGIPGEALPGSLSATEFVAWYNGHPDYRDLNPDLRGPGVAVVGMGNVAVDVARILAKSPEELESTDIADYALEALRRSRVEDVYMLGRRGPAQAKFTSKELRELGELQNADVVVRGSELELDPESAREIADDAGARRNVEILQGFAEQAPADKPRRLHLRFFVSPVRVLGEGRVQGLELERNVLEQSASGYLNAVGTGAFETLPVGMVLRSVGYRGTALPGVPFDEKRAVIPNEAGRVLTRPAGEVVPGAYVAGWIKRGPTGVIGTNKADAAETVARLLEDAASLPRAAAPEPAAVDRLLRDRGVQPVGFQDWLALDRFETEAGERLGRPRQKVTDLAEMLRRCRRELVE